MKGFPYLIALALCEVNSFTTRSYDIDVPGSKPIRIIEADPVWEPPPPYIKRERTPDIEHRTLSTTKRTDQIMDRQDNEDYEDNSHKLKDFLNNYADKIKKNRPPYVEIGGDEINFTTESDKPITEKNEKSKSWSLLHIDNQPVSYNEKKGGWVSMEAVPWSMSKISKWRPGNNEKLQNGYLHRPNNDRFQDYDEGYGAPIPKPSFQKPFRPKPQASSYYDEIDDEDPNPPPYKKPIFPRPSAVYGQKVQIHSVQSFGVEPSRPHKHNNKCNHQGGEIITDGLPPNFPDHQEYSNRRRGTNSDLPQTHPFKGEGEWVLLSTTKGYKYPKDRQRSIRFNPNSENSIDSHQSVKLTVLPPLDDGRVNMTTSHGGLLQVESTFQTVDQSQQAYAKKQKLKNRRKPLGLKYRPNGHQAPATAVAGYQQIPFNVDNNNAASNSDTASVLAAVGAGMIPAGMALLLPMTMSGRKRRELYTKFVTSSPYTDDVELTLPRSF